MTTALLLQHLLADSRIDTNRLHAADPSAHVFNNTLYIYPSHDIDSNFDDDDTGDQYAMEDYHVYSITPASVNDMSPRIDAHDHGVALHIDDVAWASKQMWAPDAAYANNRYYLYFPAKDKQGVFRIGAASADTPEGPFTAEKSYIEGTYSIDPAVYVEQQQAYIIVGGLWGGQLEKWQQGVYNSEGTEPQGDAPALTPLIAPLKNNMVELKQPLSPLQILDASGQPLKAKDTDKRYFEGPWVHKYNNVYYLSYSTGQTHYLVYATSDKIEGPYTYQGRILEPVVGWTTHHSIVEYQGEWYLFFHDAKESGGINHKRNLRVKKLTFDKNGKIQTLTP